MTTTTNRPTGPAPWPGARLAWLPAVGDTPAAWWWLPRTARPVELVPDAETYRDAAHWLHRHNTAHHADAGHCAAQRTLAAATMHLLDRTDGGNRRAGWTAATNGTEVRDRARQDT